jgi:hypothetical protein
VNPGTLNLQSSSTTWLCNQGVAADLDASDQVVYWAYAQSEGAGGLPADEMVPLETAWRYLLVR